ncbi:hypothetical protein E2C01_044296 [Portunus trituberculatus]|uniref:Uncharacterized protein n=1 Tax=Portunus trituberculatus TaxID=210409 RepID=A0A5B7FYG2_PORTR|nr:hypothetical protein [Portunus trituberculatus]
MDVNRWRALTPTKREADIPRPISPADSYRCCVEGTRSPLHPDALPAGSEETFSGTKCSCANGRDHLAQFTAQEKIRTNVSTCPEPSITSQLRLLKEVATGTPQNRMMK